MSEGSNVRWEYTSLKSNDDISEGNMIEKMNKLGKEGWELVSYGNICGSNYLYFKRRLP